MHRRFIAISRAGNAFWMGPALAILFLAAGPIYPRKASAEEVGKSGSDLFEIHVRPLLIRHCLECHGPTKQEGSLRLDRGAHLQEGGDSGAAVVPGDPAASLMLEALRYESFEMPPQGQLPEEVVAGVEQWIEAGAPWPDDTVLKASERITDEDRQWWCYQPIAEPRVPAHELAGRAGNEIDRFIGARLDSEGIDPAPEAEPLALARRVHFALTGLPPDRETIEQARSSDFDYEALVERLLQSKAYGENQARHWLDLVRFAETDGFRADHARPEAYRYRDYVIGAFNQDKPYDRFIREQLAGDEIDPGNRESLTATMYLRHWIYEHNQRDVETQWQEILSDLTETTADVFLAQGLKCARCHDHKFDPILQKDYFRFKAYFAAFQPSEAHPVADVETRKAYQAKSARWEEATADIRARLREIEYPVQLKHATREGFDKFIPKIKAMILTPPHQRTPFEKQIASLASRQFDLPDSEKLTEWLDEEAEAERLELRRRLAEFDEIKPQPLPTMKFVGSDIGPEAPETFIPDTDLPAVAPGVLTLLDPADATIVAPDEALRSTGRRTALADWITDESNPLTARVIVNRVWQQHFGRGLAETSSDFGHLGTPPSHPQLLDWLARRFVEDGWSLKKLHRRILTSATYRQSALRIPDEKLKTIDPGNRLLWRMNPRRLSGEEIVDTVRSAAGALGGKKRAVYQTVRRNSPDPVLAAFDLPDRIRSNGRRHRTTTSTQALLLANGEWLQENAAKIVQRFGNSPQDEQGLIRETYVRLFGREPALEEYEAAEEFLQQYASATPEQERDEDAGTAEMPTTGSRSLDFAPDTEVSVTLDSDGSIPDGEFTAEAVILLRSLYKDAKVRTIVSRWDGNHKHPGWSLGVTSTKSAYKPRNLIMQVVGYRPDGRTVHYEVVASDLRPELNNPYFVAASVRLVEESAEVTFYLRDLSDKKAKLQVARVATSLVASLPAQGDLAVGSRKGTHRWDGLIDSVRLEPRSRDLSETPTADSEAGLPRYVVDWQFDDTSDLGADSSGAGHRATVTRDSAPEQTPMMRARVALVHALLNSNEMIYVD